MKCRAGGIHSIDSFIRFQEYFLAGKIPIAKEEKASGIGGPSAFGPCMRAIAIAAYGAAAIENIVADHALF